MVAVEENKWAVLIGIDYYIDDNARPDMKFPSLGGCVDDVLRVEKYLLETCNVDSSHIFKLTASFPEVHQNTPKEAASQWPTYDNIISTLKHVTEVAKSGDLVYIHYSGHGARVSTIFNDIKHDNKPDEALVPTDIARKGGRYIRDVEFAYLIQEMIEKSLVVTVVFDCCHSGSANRGQRSNRVRGIDKVDRHVLASDRSDFDREQLASSLSGTDSSNGSRAVTVPSYWLLETRDYTFLAACRPHEYAHEDHFSDGTHGLLTYYLIETLKNHQHPLSYRQLCTTVLAEVRRHNDEQNVMLAGEGDRLFYSDSRIGLLQTSTVLEVLRRTKSQRTTTEEQTLVQLNCGMAHGVSDGTEFGVWPILCSNFSDSERLARIRVQSVEDVTSWGVLIELFDIDCPVTRGCQALPLSSMSIQKGVRLLYPESSDGNTQDRTALDELKTHWYQHGSKFLSIGHDIDHPFLQVRVNHGVYEVLDGGGSKIENIPRNVINNPRQLLSCLIRISKYSNVLELSTVDYMTRLSISISKKPQAFPLNARHVVDPANSYEEEHNVQAAPDGWYLLRVTNESDQVLNITILDLDSSWAIQQIHPLASGSDYDVLDVRSTLYLPLKLTMPESDKPKIIDTIKVFATVQPTSFRWLELPELGKHGASRVGTAVNQGNVLENLQALMMQDGPGVRRVSPYRPLGWMVKQVTIES